MRPYDPDPMGFLRSMMAALGEEETYDFTANPTLWLGFLLALPIPVIALTIPAIPVWMKVLAALAPFAWAVLLGAAGRVGQRARAEVEAVQSKALAIKDNLADTEEALGVEVLRRQALQQEQEDALSELKLAEAVQRSLMPLAIKAPEVEVSWKLAPSRLLGGDYIHVNVVADDWLYTIVLDVSGHGISAALVVARLHGHVRRQTLLRRTPESLLESLNRAALAICQHTYFFVTCAVARVDLRTGAMEYATAGHPAQLLLRADGSLEELRTRNRLLGIDPDIFDKEEPTRRAQLHPGDSVIFFTDGLFEVLKGGSGDLLGESGLHKRVAELGPMEPALLIGDLLQDLAAFQGRTEFDDDVSILVMRYRGPSDGV